MATPCVLAKSLAAGSTGSKSSSQYGSWLRNAFAMVAALSFTPFASSQRLIALLLIRLDASNTEGKSSLIIPLAETSSVFESSTRCHPSFFRSVLSFIIERKIHKVFNMSTRNLQTLHPGPLTKHRRLHSASTWPPFRLCARSVAPKATRPRARLSANLLRRKPRDLLAPKPHATELRDRCTSPRLPLHSDRGVSSRWGN